MAEHLDPRKVRPGQMIQVSFKPGANQNQQKTLSEMRVMLDPVRAIVVAPDEGGAYSSGIEEKEVHPRRHAQRANIEVSLYGSAAKAGIPSAVIAEAIRIYSWDIDFQRDIRAGDSLEVLYETYVTEDGAFARYGDILYASLSVNGKSIPVYRYETSDGSVDYFEPSGRSVRKALMKTPVDGARLSSGYGMRRHPILGYNKMHKGQDFAAPTGTPIYAAGDGVIERAGRWSSYGIYTRIRHNASLKTAYAHQSKLAKGIAPGVRVKQGQIIGYVGSTGRSTGPHLHYEVLQNGKHVNPSKLKLPQGETLRGAQLTKFKAHAASLDREFQAMRNDLKLAGKPVRKDRL
jgi:murein DD-endopeptidase MepM/ murein hydrolase activator NlpD